MLKSSYNLQVLVNNRPVKEYLSSGDTYIEGREGSEFDLRFTNSGWTRVEVVISVDGLSIMDGKPASTKSSGYVVGVGESITIPGWRLSGSEVAKFKFSDKRASYAGAFGNDITNCGVIGVAVWSEKPRFHHFVPFNSNDIWYAGGGITGSTGDSMTTLGTVFSSSVATNSLSSSSAARPVEMKTAGSINNIGTEFGKAAKFDTIATTFSRDTYSTNMSLYYDNAKGLRARGIVLSNHVRPNPNPFPADGCRPPANWSRNA